MLEDTLVPIDFGGGIDQRADPKQTIPTKMARLENATLIYGKQIQKRYGYVTVANTRQPNTSEIQTAESLDQFNGNMFFRHSSFDGSDGSFVTTSGDTIFYPGTNDKCAPAGSIENNLLVQIDRVPQNINVSIFQASIIGAPDVAAIGTIVAVAALYGNDGFCQPYVTKMVYPSYAVLSTETGIASATWNSIRLLTANNMFVVGVGGFTSNGIITAAFINSLSLTASVAVTININNTLNTSRPFWDWARIGDNIYVAWVSAASIVGYAMIDPTTMAVSTISSFTAATTIDAICIANSAVSGADQVRIITAHPGSGIQCRYFNTGTMAPGTSFGGANRSISAYTQTVTQLSAHYGSSDGTASLFVCANSAITAGATSSLFIGVWSIDGTSPTFLKSMTASGIGSISKPTRLSGKLYQGVMYGSGAQGQHFLMRYDINAKNYPTGSSGAMFVAARYLYGENQPSTGGYLTMNRLSQFVVFPDEENLGSSVIAYATLRSEQQIQQVLASSSVIAPNISLVVTNLTKRQGLRSVELGDANIPGGYVGAFDGAPGVMENNFFLYPDFFTATTQVTGGSLSSGTYQYRALYEYVDAQGKLHRSGVSPVLSITTGNTTTNLVTISALALPYTSKYNKGVPKLVLYRTEANGSVFYSASSVQVPNAVIAARTISDTTSDATLISKQVLYTQGGELPNWAPNAGSAIASGQNRVFVNDTSDDGIVYFSKAIVSGDAPSFSQSLYIRVPTSGGPVTAIVAMSDRVFIFKKSALYVVTGTGPDATGQASDYSDAQHIPIDGGAESQAAVCTTPIGIVCKGYKTWNLVGYDLSWRDIGDQVRNYTSYRVLSSQLVPEKREVRFVLSDGAGMLHYNYEFQDQEGIGQWYLNTKGFRDCQYTNGNFYAVDSTTKQVVVETPDVYTDTTYTTNSTSTTTYSMLAETAWIGVQRQGIQRVRSIYILGETSAEAVTANRGVTIPISVEIAYDYSNTFSTVSYVASFVTSSASAVAFQIEIRPQQQKCETIKLRITETGAGTAGFSLANMTFRVAMKQGGPKLPPSRRAT